MIAPAEIGRGVALILDSGVGGGRVTALDAPDGAGWFLAARYGGAELWAHCSEVSLAPPAPIAPSAGAGIDIARRAGGAS